MSKRKAFNFYCSYFETANLLPDKERLQFYDAIMQKQFYGIEPKDLKGMLQFAWVSQKHSIEAQVKGWEDKTGENLQLIDNNSTLPSSQPPYVPPSQPPSQQEKEKEKEEEKEEEKGQVQEKFDFKKSLINYGFDESLVNDWILVRKNKKATNSQTAYNVFISEIEKRDCNINSILGYVVGKSWSGFKWQWIDNENKSTGVAQKKSNIEVLAEAYYDNSLKEKYLKEEENE